MADGGEPKKDEEPGLPEKINEFDGESTSEWLARTLAKSLGIKDEGAAEKREPIIPLNIEGVAQHIKDGKAKNIVVMTGAGISTSAGIPDFRSPGTGLYDNLQKYNLPEPHAIFDIGFFRENPEPFFALAKELYPGTFKPTPCHYFLKLLSDKGLLLRSFTQNIDTLERVAGLPGDKIMEAHGTFHTSHCLECNKEYTQEWMKDRIFADVVPRCTSEDCVQGVVKPDIVFFGQALPPDFFGQVQADLPACDLLIVMGTSLVVQPFASLVHKVSEDIPRLYINLEKGNTASDPFLMLLGMGSGFMFDSEDNYRDVFWKGTCDDGCYKLAELLGWEKELRDLVNREHTRIDAETAATTGAEAAATPEKSAAKSPAAAKGISPKSSGKAPRTGSPKTKAENLGGSPGENKKGGKGSPKSTVGKL